MKLLPREMILRSVNTSEYDDSGKVHVMLSSPVEKRGDGTDSPFIGTYTAPDANLHLTVRPSQVAKFPPVGTKVTVTTRINWEGEDI